MAYSKLYSSIVHSSLWTEPDHIRLLFITLLALADREGYVFGSRNGLLRAANLDLAQCEHNDPFEALLGPDKDSSDLLRNPENEGRRIEQVDGGFRLLNFAHYSRIFDGEDRREQNRLAQLRHREKEKSMTVSKRQQPSAEVSKSKPSDIYIIIIESISEAKKHPYWKQFKRFCQAKGGSPTLQGFNTWLNSQVPPPSQNPAKPPAGYAAALEASMKEADKDAQC